MQNSKKITEKAMQEFLITELNIPKDLYYKFMKLNKLAGMTDEKYQVLLNKIENHFNRKIELPSVTKILSCPTQIINAMNKVGKLYE